MSLQPIRSTAAFRSAIEEKEVTFVAFSTKWCPPCKVLNPILAELQQEEADRLRVVSVDCDEAPELAARFGVMSTPTVIAFHRGEPIEKLIGLRPKGVYQAVLARHA